MMQNDSGFDSFCSESSFNASAGTSTDKAPTEGKILILGKFNSFDSILSASESSVRTQLTGLDDDSVISEYSIIPDTKDLVWSDRENMDLDGDSNLSVGSFHYSNVAEMHKNSDSEIASPRKRTYLGDITNSGTPSKQYENPIHSGISPDLFDADAAEKEKQTSPVKKPSPGAHKPKYPAQDVKLLHKIKSSLTGLDPPTHLTVVQLNVEEMLDKIRANKDFFWDQTLTDKAKTVPPSTLISDKFESIFTAWPNILKVRQHGLHYNRGGISEDIEHLCTRYGERYVGAETQSTCTIFKATTINLPFTRNMRPRWAVKSPGKRLSHLARRRITFSSNSSLQSSSSRSRQILVDAKKLSLIVNNDVSKKPSPVKKTVDSRLQRVPSELDFGNISSVASTSSSSSNLSYKRVLFPSPDKDSNSSSSSLFSLDDKFLTRRSLFCNNRTDFADLLSRKRKPSESSVCSEPPKIARSISFGGGNKQTKMSLLNRPASATSQEVKTVKSKNDSLLLFKEKFQMAVYDALRMHNITLSHPQCKSYASTLARVTKKIFTALDMNTSDELKRIARYHAHMVFKGKSVDEIVAESGYLKTKSKKNSETVKEDAKEEDENKENIPLEKTEIMASIEKRRQQAGAKTKFHAESRLDRIRRVISFDDD